MSANPDMARTKVAMLLIPHLDSAIRPLLSPKIPFLGLRQWVTQQDPKKNGNRNLGRLIGEAFW